MGRPINSVFVLLSVFEYPRTLRGGRGPRRREVRPRRRELRLEAGDVRPCLATRCTASRSDPLGLAKWGKLAKILAGSF